MIPACRRSSHHEGQFLSQAKEYECCELVHLPMHWYVMSRLPLKLLKDRSNDCKSVMFDHFGRGPAKREQHSFQKALQTSLPLHSQTRMLTCTCLRVQGEIAQGASMSRGQALSDRHGTADALWRIPETADCDLVPGHAHAYGVSDAPHHSGCWCEAPDPPDSPGLPSHRAVSLRSTKIP